MNILYDVLLNYYFLAFIIAWILSIVIKTIIAAFENKKNIDIVDGFKNGGMPSSHSAAVSSITSAILFLQGASSAFFVALVFSAIVISDAFRLRYNVGIQAQELNVLLKRSKRKPVPVVNGHTFVQVMAGIILGVAVSGIIYLIMF